MEIKPSQVGKTFMTALKKIVGEGSCSIKSLDRVGYSRDSAFRSTIQNYYGKVPHLPDVICWPHTTQEISQVIKLCRKYKVPVIPFTAGSGVSEGVIPDRGGLLMDIKKLNRVLNFDPENLLITIEAGFMGLHLEEWLNEKGYTLGHFPSSIICAGVGGYLAARSAGQQSSRYGKIEDMVRDVEVVTGTGEVIQTKFTQNQAGLDLNQIFIGSEGTLCVFTKVTLRIYPKPETLAFSGFRFLNMKDSVEALRRVMQAGFKPSVVRLYDEIDTLLLLSNKKKKKHEKKEPSNSFENFFHFLKNKSLQAILSFPSLILKAAKLLPTGCQVVFMHEGTKELVACEQKMVRDIALSLQARDLGEAPGRHWFAHRYDVSFKASLLFESGLFTDTIEVATTWENLVPLYEEVIKALSPHVLAMAHLSHVYTDGGCLYFTFAAPLKGKDRSIDFYDMVWEKAMLATQKMGGVISHHHGVGRLKAKFMEKEWGQGADLFRALKTYYDPDGIMNPGKLIAC